METTTHPTPAVLVPREVIITFTVKVMEPLDVTLAALRKELEAQLEASSPAEHASILADFFGETICTYGDEMEMLIEGRDNEAAEQAEDSLLNFFAAAGYEEVRVDCSVHNEYEDWAQYLHDEMEARGDLSQP